MPRDIRTFNHRDGPIKILHDSTELRPTEVHLKENGTLDNKPSFCIVMTDPKHLLRPVYGQISLKMLDEALNELGYTINKINS